MEKKDALTFMRTFAKARKDGAEKVAQFNRDMDLVLKRLIYEGVANYMSAEQIALEVGLSTVRVRKAMRAAGLSPNLGKRTLADNAAKALQENSGLMGIKPWQMDLTSPLAYLPMGSRLREELTEAGIARVTEIED